MALDPKDILLYEEQSPIQSLSPSPDMTSGVKPVVNTNRAEFWDGFKSRVLHDLQYGSITNTKKKKKVVKPPTPEPEPDPITHMDIHSVFELMDGFKPHERTKVIDILLDFTYSKFQGTYLLD